MSKFAEAIRKIQVTVIRYLCPFCQYHTHSLDYLAKHMIDSHHHEMNDEELRGIDDYFNESR